MLSPRFLDAFIYAGRAHAGQSRRGSDTPYLAHLMAVTALVVEDGGDEDEAIAALLHDAVEDQGGRERLDDIRVRFGARVARIVEGCTDSFATPAPSWIARKRAYVEHVRHVSPDVLRVAAADKVVNVSAILRDYHRIGAAAWARCDAPAPHVVWYYAALVDAFRPAGGGALVEELARLVAELVAATGIAPVAP